MAQDIEARKKYAAEVGLGFEIPKEGSMNTVELEQTLEKIFKGDDRRIVPLLLGAPGVGKTSIVGQAAQKAGLSLMTLALPTCEAVDLRGIPQIVDGQTRWASPMPREGRGVLLLDELSSAAPDVQVAAHHLVWAEVGSDMSLPLGWHIVLTGNRSVDKTFYRAVSGPLRNRLCILPIDAHASQWAEWAMNNQIDHSIIGFLRWRPELLTAKEIPNDGAFPSPRSWHRCTEILNLGVPASVELEMIVGTIGEGAAVEFSAYLRTVRELPSIQTIINRPFETEVPKSPSLLYAIVSNLSQYSREKKKSIMDYVSRMPAEFGLLYIRDIRDHMDINTPDIRNWIKKHKNLFDSDNL
jgi:hypothetical protein